MVSIRKRNSKTSYGLFWFLNFPHATRNFHAPTHFQLAHAQTNFPAVAKCKIHQKSRAHGYGSWVNLLTDLKNMADRQEWKGQRFIK